MSDPALPPFSWAPICVVRTPGSGAFHIAARQLALGVWAGQRTGRAVHLVAWGPRAVAAIGAARRLAQRPDRARLSGLAGAGHLIWMGRGDGRGAGPQNRPFRQGVFAALH